MAEAVTKLTVFMMIIGWLQGVFMTQKILIIRVLGMMMRRMIPGLGSPYMKWIVAFTKKLAW